MLGSISKFLSNRYELLFGRDVSGPESFGVWRDNRPLCPRFPGGGTRPHKRGCYARSGAGAIEVLRINALSLYEDKRISTRRAALRRVSRCLPLATSR